MKKRIVAGACAFCIFILGISVFLNVKNSREQMEILEQSICSQLLSVSVAAREIILQENYDFAEWNSLADVQEDWDSYVHLRSKLRTLVEESNVEYVYALKLIDGEYQFVLDSDPEDEEVFIEYDMADVHLQAFAGKAAAGIMNVQDEYGNFNTGAVPIYDESGTLLGIVSVDISDEYVQQSFAATRRNSTILIVSLVLAAGVMLSFMIVLLKKLNKAHDKLQHLAHYDRLTGLPNRQYLFETLDHISERGSAAADTPYAIIFMDLDNFKQVNDHAGHDAGDALLQNMGKLLLDEFKDSQTFRPTAGMLNVSARIGGDEFVQIVPGVATVAEAETVAEKLVTSFNNSGIQHYIEKYNVGISVGVALYPMHTTNYNVLIKYADIAMYHAKKGGKNTWRIYNEDMAPKEEK